MLKNMKSIKAKLLATTLSILCVALVAVGGISACLNYSSTIQSLEQTMIETVEVAANQVDAKLQEYRTLLLEIASRDTLKSGNREQMVQEFRGLEQRHGFTMVATTDREGNSPDAGVNVADRDYFQVPKATGQVFVSDPVVRKDTGAVNLFISAPLMENGTFTGIVFAGVDATFLCDLVTGIQTGSTGNAAIIDQNGTTIAYYDVQLVLDAYNTNAEVKNDPQLAKLAANERELMEGKTGFGSYTYGGKNKFMAYTPVPNTNGWGIYVTVEQREFLQSTYTGIFIICVVALGALVAGLAAIFGVTSTITKPIRACADRLLLLSKGDLQAPVPTVHARDETGILAESTKTLVDGLNTIIRDEQFLLAELAAGNFSVKSATPESYIGDFEPLLLSLRTIRNDISSTLRQINNASEQVSSGSEQVSGGAQALSQGTTEQASSVEELAATINEISQQVKETAGNAGLASRKMSEASDDISVSNRKMQDLIQAMEDISKSSQEIGTVIKAIEDIAFQTNILALNAAVEAARAGAAGKGFAVVADEVRNLASKSAEAAKGTTALIEGAIQAVGNGTQLADDTAKSLEQVVETANEVAGIVNRISEASGEQADAIMQVTLGVDQISSVVQTNSATAEESAAAAEELSAQASMLKKLVGKFQLLDNAIGSNPAQVSQTALHSSVDRFWENKYD